MQSSSIGPPKWDPLSCLGIYVGCPLFHAGSVSLVLNPCTGHVSPQYYVVFDDDFTTVPYLNSLDVPDHWAALVKSGSESATDKGYSLADTWFQHTMDPDSNADQSVEVQFRIHLHLLFPFCLLIRMSLIQREGQHLPLLKMLILQCPTWLTMVLPQIQREFQPLHLRFLLEFLIIL